MKNYVRQASVSQLKNIKPNELKKELEVDIETFNDFIKALNKERLLTYKYKVKCDSCGDINTI